MVRIPSVEVDLSVTHTHEWMNAASCHSMFQVEGRKEGNVLFNDALR